MAFALPAPNIYTCGCQTNGTLFASTINHNRCAFFSQREKVRSTSFARGDTSVMQSNEELITPISCTHCTAPIRASRRTSAKKLRQDMRKRIQKVRREHALAMQFNQESARQLHLRLIIDIPSGFRI